MRVKLIASYGVLAHEKRPVYRYAPGVNADHWNCEEDVWVEIPDEYIAGRTVTGELIVNFGERDYPLWDCITNFGDDPVLIVPSLTNGRRIKLRVLEPQELPRQTSTDTALARIRRERGLTQADMAEKLGVHTTQYARWERGESEPRIGMLQKIADALGISPAELLN